MENSKRSSDDVKADEAQTAIVKHGGWITLPFIAGSMLGLGLAVSATSSNLVVYMIKEYNIKNIAATQIANTFRGTLNLVPLVGAIIADAYLGCFPVVVVSTVISLLSFVTFTLTAAIRSLRPSPCFSSTAGCQSPSAGQLAVLYIAVCLLAIGTGGTRYTIAAMGADQFDHPKDQDIFFNWFFICLYTAFMIGDTLIVYIQDGVSWALGFGLCIAATAFSLVLLLIGGRYYRKPVLKGSPFTGLVQVVVATARKAKVNIGGNDSVHYYQGASGTTVDAPSKPFSFLNRAAVVMSGDLHENGAVAKPWRICTIRQVEDFKNLIRLFPLWSSCILASVSISIVISMTILQALTMDRSFGHRFSVPAASLAVINFVGFTFFAFLFDRILFPLWHSLTGETLTPLQRIGLGFIVNITSVMIAALVERHRINIVHLNNAEDQPKWIAPMSAMWLVVQLGVMGIGEALHFPGEMALFYQEFPKALRSTATSMAPLLIALGYYLSTVFVHLIQSLTKWLPDNMNQSRLDNVYWTVAVISAINFIYFFICASLYRYQNQEVITDKVEVTDH